MKLTFPTIYRTIAIDVVIVVIYFVIALWLMRTLGASWWSVGIAAYIASLLILALWRVPKRQVASLPAKGVKAEDVFKAENDARATLAQILGGFAVLIGLYFAWDNIVATKEGQITDRFTNAIKQMGATDKGEPNLELRIGGIYALERIARDSERDYWPIMELLTAYVRDHGPWCPNSVPVDPKTPLGEDIKAIVAIIHGREWSYEDQYHALDLHITDLHHAPLGGTHLIGAYLEDTDLEEANLQGAYLMRAYLEDAYLTHADLIGADLRGTSGVTQAQIKLAIGDTTTKLPMGITMPGSWKKKVAWKREPSSLGTPQSCKKQPSS